MKLLNLAIIGGLGYLGYTMLTKKKEAPPSAPEAPTAEAPAKGMTAEELDVAIDQWMAAHPGEQLPGWMAEQGMEMGLII